jgi:hypothetical protein
MERRGYKRPSARSFKCGTCRPTGWLILVVVLATAPVRGSEEELLPWQEVRIVCAERVETGPVELTARTVSNEIVAVSITAFGKKHDVPAADLAKLRGFPLDSLRLTHEAGYAELGGHTVHLRFKRNSCVPGGWVEETVAISVSRGKGLTIGEPQRRELSKLPQHAWETVLRAMQAGDKTALAQACTDRGYQSIVKGHRAQEISNDDLRALGKSWAKWEMRFTSQTADAAQANMGPADKEHGLKFIKTPDGWKLDQWLPGH